MELDRFRELLKRSSLGTPDTQALQASVPPGIVERIVNRAEELERSQPVERKACSKPVATSADPDEGAVERARSALRTVFVSWECGAGKLAGMSAPAERVPFALHWDQALQDLDEACWDHKLVQHTIEELLRARGEPRPAPHRRSRMRLRYPAPASGEWAAAMTRSQELYQELHQDLSMLVACNWAPRSTWVSLFGVVEAVRTIVRQAGRLFGRHPSPTRVNNPLKAGTWFTFGDFCRHAVPPVERAAQLMINDHNLERKCVNEAVAAALAQASNRWRLLAAHPAPTAWTVRIALQALDPTIVAAGCAYSVGRTGLRQEWCQTIVDSLLRMPTHQREVIGLWATCRFEPNQIAYVLKLPERRVRQVKDQALRQLQDADPCADQGGDPRCSRSRS
jgi:hypothetical protein